MNTRVVPGIDCRGLDAAFEADEALASNLIIEARMLNDQGKPDEAAERYARAAVIEERLAGVCRAKGLRQRSWVHGYSAASCSAHAGNFYAALRLADELLAQEDVPAPLRQSVTEFADAPRARRRQWLAGLVSGVSPAGASMPV
jgi:hypothetical protein